MSTTVTITGTGTPIQRPDRAGAGVLITHDDVALQFDAGRGTVLRLAGAGQPLMELDALFVTHHHSDHIIGIPDLVMTRWYNDIRRTGQAPLPIYVPDGPAARIIERMLDVWEEEITLRQEHTQRPNRPEMDVRRFTASREETVRIARFGDLDVRAISVEHEPVIPAVGYQIATPDGSIVISGDTAVCPQIEALAAGADVLVHEAMRRTGLAGILSRPDALAAYHADCTQLGAMAARAGVKQLILTHLIPPPDGVSDKAGFESDVRAGGYSGPVVVADDLTRVEL